MCRQARLAPVLASLVAVAIGGCGPLYEVPIGEGWGPPPRFEPDWEAEARAHGSPALREAELEPAIAEALADGRYRRDARIDADLASTEPVEVPLKEGYCYRFVARLGEGAEWSPRARSGVKFRLWESLSSTMRGSGVVSDRFCVTTEDVIAPLRLVPVVWTLGSQNAIGRGAYTIEVWAHRMSRTERTEVEAEQAARHAERVARTQARLAQADLERERQRAAPGCLRCRLAWNDCAAASETTDACDARYQQCLFHHVRWGRETCPAPY